MAKGYASTRTRSIYDCHDIIATVAGSGVVALDYDGYSETAALSDAGRYVYDCGDHANL